MQAFQATYPERWQDVIMGPYLDPHIRKRVQFQVGGPGGPVLHLRDVVCWCICDDTC